MDAEPVHPSVMQQKQVGHIRSDTFIMNAKEKEFTALVQEYKTTIYTICLMNAADKDEAQDLMQEVLIQLWRSFGTFRGESNVRTWIWRISMNTCISYCRKEEKHRQSLHIQVGDILNAEDENNSQIQILHERIHKLQPFDRTLVLLWLEELSYEEIGEIIGISAKNVSVRLVRIKEQLRKM